MSIENARFSFYEYHDRIIALLVEGFPLLADAGVCFMPAEDGETRQFADLPKPAFVMSWGDVEPLKNGVPMRDLEQGGRRQRTAGGNIDGLNINDLQFYMDIKVNVVGHLVLPKFPSDIDEASDINPDNLNPLLMLHQAATNIAALIFAAARGWKCDEAMIEEIAYVPDDDYEIMKVAWSHKAVVGRDDNDTANLSGLFRQWILCADSENPMTLESEPLDLGDDDVSS